MQRLTFEVSDEMHEWLKRRAKESDTNVSAYLKKLLFEKLLQESVKAERKRIKGVI